MHRKNLAFEQVFDVRAVRIITSSLEDCYAALGVVHGRWHYIPGEFDDYIATPKDNLYRSLHTAVLGPAAVPVEIQIRTREMHDHAELGVAAHWRYKEGAARDAAYDRKIEWLRELLAPASEAESRLRLPDARARGPVRRPRLCADAQGRGRRPAVAVRRRSTSPITCTRSSVTAAAVRASTAASCPSTITSPTAKWSRSSAARRPSRRRDWLVEREGYLASPRSRAKVRAWFKRQDMGENRREGREMFERELARLGAEHSLTSDLIGEFGLTSADALHARDRLRRPRARPGGGCDRAAPARPDAAAVRPRTCRRSARPARTRRPRSRSRASATCMSTHARCCNPVPPEPVTGYVTVGRGITLHRTSCRNLRSLATRAPQRLLQVDWGKAAGRRYPVDIVVRAMDRRGLLRDITTVVAEERIDIERLASQGDPAQGSADLTLRVAVGGLDELSRLLARLSAMPGIISARRRA